MQTIPNEATDVRKEGRKKRRPSVTFHDEVVFDDGTRVLINRLLDQGDNRRVYLARDVRDDKQLYALKRVDCQNDPEAEQCRREADVHRRFSNDNVMPILGVKFVQTPEAEHLSCFMLFPYLTRSLRDEIDSRRLLEDRPEKQRRPFSTHQVLAIFAGILRAVKALHDAGLSHRDIRPENVLLQKSRGPQTKRKKRREDVGTPVLTDFGSAGPLTALLSSDADIATAREDVERCTSAAFRAPELFDLVESDQVATSESNKILQSFYDSSTLLRGAGEKTFPSLQYGPADVWSLGCLLFSVLYGLSPFEMEWKISLVEGAEADGTVQYVGASYERVVEDVPFPPDGSAADGRYGEEVTGLVRWMLNEDPKDRPIVGEILAKVESLLGKKEHCL